jgi:hypothetical protein
VVGHGHLSSPASPEIRAHHAEGAVRAESGDLLSAGPPNQHDDRLPAYFAAAAGAEPGLIYTFLRRNPVRARFIARTYGLE